MAISRERVFEGDEVIYYDEVNAGVAVANDAGLMIVVVKGIDRKDLSPLEYRKAQKENRGKILTNKERA